MSSGVFLSPEYDIDSFQNGKLLLKNKSNISKTLPATDNSEVYNKSDHTFVSTVKDFITHNLGSNIDDNELTNKYYVKYFLNTKPSGGKRTRRKMRKTRRRRKTRYSKNKK